MNIRNLTIAALLLGSTAVAAEQAGAPPRLPPGMVPGYLALEAVPDSAALVPPAPAKKSGTEARDKAASRVALAARSTPRWAFAASDADLFSPKATGALSCAAGFEISPQTTPKLDKLLRRTIIDFGFSTYRAKQKFNRDRPFETNKRPICTPDQDAMLRKDGSYPSGHSAIGFGWGLMLAGLVPDRATQVVSRGRAFGESRRFCNVHWQSDVEEGRIVAAAVYARLQADAAYQADLAAVREELASAPRQAPARDCAAEASALAGG
ncbi:phosphatase PAP2 family protein [Novosphingobium sp.]|uniref:acid phosphatase n=1 Tax=Novosphingobium sp. TaxID=1874826 RepID=UPI0027370200|nr:phosphatase PAP2 family protein [Novosphingobium sp.]MDP3907359.1 phosphatase PAP2 family protein [Novosphingobium sp.]